MHEKIPLQAVEIEINSACNRACSYCPNAVGERKTKGVMSEDLYRHILKNLQDISFSGRISHNFYNEPTLHPQLAHFTQMTKAALPASKIHLYSNGTLLNLAKTTELFESGVDKMIITQHEVDMDSSKYQFADTLKQLPANLREKIVYKNHHDLHLVNRGGLLKHLGAEGLPLLPCYIPSHMLNVTVDGRVLSCFEDFNEHLVFGDLKTESLSEIWNKESYKNFREDLKKGLRHKHTPCKDCNRTEALPPFDQ